jgi:hypothetical protein
MACAGVDNLCAQPTGFAALSVKLERWQAGRKADKATWNL